MPTIRPAELRRQADAIADLIDQPEAMLKALVKLLTFYADRIRRAPGSMTPSEAAPGFGVPRPVVHALASSFQRQLDVVPAQRQNLIDTLWDAGFSETKALAAELLSDVPWPHVIEQVEKWARLADDPGSVEVLAVEALSHWDRQDQEAVVGPITRWLRSRTPALNRLGLLAIQHQARSVSDARLSIYFGSLEGLIGRFEGAAQRTLLEILSDLIDRNPSETARFLIDELRRHNLNPKYVSFVRQLLARFPEPQRSELGHTLSPH
jgi:hypothetical protein